jgi:ribosomal protein S18 acetylase RimI-like enzyme
VTIALRHAESDAEIALCFPLMRELRPDLASAAAFAAYVGRQRPFGYRLLAAWRDAAPVALAGYRRQENLVHGRHLFVDDLVTAEGERGQRHGAHLLAAIAAEARALQCRKVVLGTALANSLAQRFYYRQGMLATGLSFSLALD